MIRGRDKHQRRPTGLVLSETKTQEYPSCRQTVWLNVEVQCSEQTKKSNTPAYVTISADVDPLDSDTAVTHAPAQVNSTSKLQRVGNEQQLQSINESLIYIYIYLYSSNDSHEKT